MEVDIRRAAADDIAAILEVKHATWPDESGNAACVSDVLRDPGHVSLVTAVDGRVAGFVDGFLTLSSEGVRRWEVDLLAVHPAYRNQGLASRLVAENTRSGFEMGADMARALINVDNPASQHTFARYAYTRNSSEHALYISIEASDSGVSLPSDAHLVPVSTFNYRGLWVEGTRSTDSLQYAQKVRARYGYDLAGAVIPVSQCEVIQSAIDAGFTLVGRYQWWLLKADVAPILC